MRQLAAQEHQVYGPQVLILREVIAHHPNAADTLRAEMISAGTCRNAVDCTTTTTVLRRAAAPE
ncbi:hypothetical protein ACFY4C_35190 [Actinomadura viridis]|uniref:hypothetical protein n=1 Tax=Actinomadura viridis TaxID=58110 RepID=UPI003689CE5F